MECANPILAQLISRYETELKNTENACLEPELSQNLLLRRVEAKEIQSFLACNVSWFALIVLIISLTKPAVCGLYV